jgi:hypothetical protein
METKELIPLVDADGIVYRVGFAVKEEEPLEYALATVRSVIRNIWDVFPVNKDKGQLFLTGKRNFRDAVATLQPYKGNRDPTHRPKYYPEIRQYIETYYPTTVVHGMEAEDACGIAQYAAKDRSTVIVGVDKDLRCLPGWHYNPVKEVLFYQTLADANYWFWAQVLSGDRTDNIPGIKGLGESKKGKLSSRIEKLLAPAEKDWGRMQDIVLAQYRKQYGDAAEQAMHEVATLIWILRKEGETYNGSQISTQAYT